MSMYLVTGAPGWIGSRLVRTLLFGNADARSEKEPSSQHCVRCLVLPNWDTSTLGTSDRLEVVRGDLRNVDAVRTFLRGAEGATLFHCAGVIHPSLFLRELMEVNVQGTENLLRVAEEVGVRRVIALSSNSAAGMNPSPDHRFDEASPYNPDMGYGHSKMLMEKAIHEVQSRGKLETVILRPMWFYGPDQPERQTTFFRMIKNGGAPIIRGGAGLRSLTYVDSLSQAMLLSEKKPIANGQTYWVADSRPYAMSEIVNTVERLMETEFGLRVAHKRLRLPTLAADAAHLADLVIQKSGLYNSKVHVLSQMDKTIACSIEKAKKELGYAPVVELEEGMRRSLAWCAENRIVL